MRTVFGLLVFLAAFLLFAVEPMAAKELLPVLGGASAVWVTCLVFFQCALLSGYAYAHLAARRGWARAHLVLLGAAVIAVAIAATARGAEFAFGLEVHSSPTVSLHPVRTIFSVLSVTIGLPFLVLAATTPLLQVWWVRLGGERLPYGLFALSNAGSLLGLVLYPVLIEPNLTLAMQWGVWAFGFGLYAALCAWMALRVSRVGAVAAVEDLPADAGPIVIERAGSWRRWMWFLLPMGAAMQLSAVTSHLSQDVAAIPMLWVLPLGVYLVTFILAFEAPGLYRRWVMGRALAVMLASLAYALSRVDTTLPIGMAIAFYMVELLVACWFCHAEAYRLRPGRAEESTSFYLLVAAGGATGTFLVAVVSPLVFRANYDLVLAFLVTAALAAAVTWRDGWAQRALWVTGTALLVALAVMLHIGFARNALLRARNFYGALRVVQSQTDATAYEENGARTAAAGSGDTGSGPVRTLMNGRIRHGTQMQDADRRDTPTTYYARDSGVGVALRLCCDGGPKRVGVVGLGVGTVAAYGRAGDVIRFYEINPLVEPIARNLFTYIRDTRAQVTVTEGDGRASLNGEAPQNFNVLVVDAFSGDAIPLHLLTREAMAVYTRQLAPGGVVAFHVSNSYLELAPEILLLAQSSGLTARRVDNFAAPAEDAYRSTWVLVSDAAFFEKAGVADAATPILPQPGLRLWTDDYSSLLAVMRWR
jgi:hypothetical protein